MSQYYKYDDIQTDEAANSIHECIEQLKLSGICNQKIMTALLGEAHGLSDERKECEE
jgi:hypothetical protein